MANFRIDYLKLTRNQLTGKYELEGKCNLNKAPNGKSVVGNAVALNILFDTANLDPDDYLSFQVAQEVDFSTLHMNGEELFSLRFNDISGGTGTQYNKGHILIKDTRYPPPIDFVDNYKHLGFSSQFTVESFTAIRAGILPIFSVIVELSYRSNSTKYAYWDFTSYDDTIEERNQKVMLMKVNQTVTGGVEQGSFTFVDNSINLNDSDGRAFIIFDKSVTWSKDIDIKKISVFID